MKLQGPVAFGMLATPFNADGSLDEEGIRAHVGKVADSGCGVYLGSGGSGEGQALSLSEISRVYELGVEVCSGRVPTCAIPPEPRTANAMILVAKAAAAAGVDLVQIYLVDAGHAMRPTPRELEHYLRTVLDAVDHPIALSVHVHSYANYQPRPTMFAKLCEDYPQIRAINVIDTPLAYYVELMDAVGPRIDLYTGVRQVLEGLPMGAAGYLAAEPNIAPYLCRSVIEHFIRGETEACAKAVANILRLQTIVNRWAPANPRWIKMAMKVLDLPGGNGVLRPPYLLPDQTELDELARALDAFGLRRIEEAARVVCERTSQESGSRRDPAKLSPTE